MRASPLPVTRAKDDFLVRNRVLAAARDEFASRGLHAASVHSIGKRAGVTGAMINYYFGSKRALYDTVVTEAQGRLMVRLSAALQEGPAKLGTPARLAGAYFDFLAEDRQLQQILLREVLDRDEVRERTAGFVRPLRALLEQQFDGDEAAVQGAISLFGAVAGYFIYGPVLGPFLDRDPLSPGALASRRKHVIQLASLLEKWSRK